MELKNDQQSTVYIAAEKIHVQLLGGNFEAAKHTIDALEIELSKEAEETTLDTALVEHLDVETCNSLEKHLGVITFRDLMSKTYVQVAAVPNLGHLRVTEIEQVCMRFGIQWPSCD